jgi:hypothetical protein
LATGFGEPHIAVRTFGNVEKDACIVGDTGAEFGNRPVHGDAANALQAFFGKPHGTIRSGGNAPGFCSRRHASTGLGDDACRCDAPDAVAVLLGEPHIAVWPRCDVFDARIGHLERETFDAFLSLPTSQRKAIREIIQALASSAQASEVPTLPRKGGEPN